MRFDDPPFAKDQDGYKWWYKGASSTVYREESSNGSGWIRLDGKTYSYKNADECKRLIRLVAFL